MDLSGNNLTRIIALIAVVFGGIAIVLSCVGIGTPNWQSTYTWTSGSAQLSSTTNFFYYCSWSSGSFVGCYSRNASMLGYTSGLTGTYAPSNDTYNRAQNAAGLSIVGIILIGIGTVSTLLMVFLNNFTILLFLAPFIFFLACLFMLAGLAEGARVLIYNDYAANLYETGHLLTIFATTLSAMAAGRYQAVKV